MKLIIYYDSLMNMFPVEQCSIIYRLGTT